jgi:hypothetical protein
MQNPKNKPFQLVAGGEYDPYGFYYTPNGSFWDPDGIYFSAEGYDAHGGYYDEKLEYVPGPGWITELLCYEDEKASVLNAVKLSSHQPPMGHLAEAADEDLFDEEGDIEELYEEIDYDKLMREEENKMSISNNIDSTERNNKEPLGASVNDSIKTEARKVFNPREAAKAHLDNMKNLANDVNNINLQQYDGNRSNNSHYSNKNHNNNWSSCNDNKEKKAGLEEKLEKPVITPDMLFNKIPENLKPKNPSEEGVSKKETKIEVDSLFG